MKNLKDLKSNFKNIEITIQDFLKDLTDHVFENYKNLKLNKENSRSIADLLCKIEKLNEQVSNAQYYAAQHVFEAYPEIFCDVDSVNNKNLKRRAEIN